MILIVMLLVGSQKRYIPIVNIEGYVLNVLLIVFGVIGFIFALFYILKFLLKFLFKALRFIYINMKEKGRAYYVSLEEAIMKNQRGFTLIEIMAVMVIMGVVASVGVKKGVFVRDIAETAVARSVISSLNSNETMVWGRTLIKGDYQTDFDVWNHKDEILDVGNRTKVQFHTVTQTGATVSINGNRAVLKRTPSVLSSGGRWDFST
jgi:prepilin-type N-terminal cleavage/methylation domain-containing protein